MRAYQIHLTALAGCRYLALACFGPSTDRWAGSERSAVPNSPGRARHFYPYPISRRRRRQ